MYYAVRLLRNYRSKLLVKDFVFSLILPIITYCLHTFNFTTLQLSFFLESERFKNYFAAIKTNWHNLCQIKKGDILSHVENQINQAADKMYERLVSSDLRRTVFTSIQKQFHPAISE
ncbi:Uncharacterised protein at_DN0624 [Pycnogonum litorale]